MSSPLSPLPFAARIWLCGCPAAPAPSSLCSQEGTICARCTPHLLCSAFELVDVDTGKMLFQRSLEVSLEIFLLTRWHSLQFFKATLEMWKDKFCWESTSNFPKIYWSQLQSPEGVMVWEAVVTLLLQHYIFIPGEVLYSQVLCVYNFPISPHLPTCNLSVPVL